MKRIWNDNNFLKKISELMDLPVQLIIPPAQKNGPGALLVMGHKGVVGLWSGGEELHNGMMRVTHDEIDAVSAFMCEHNIDPKWGWWFFGENNDPVIMSHAKMFEWRMKTVLHVDIVVHKTRALSDIRREEMQRMIAKMGWPCKYLDELRDLADAFVEEGQWGLAEKGYDWNNF